MPGDDCEALMGALSLIAGLAAGASFFRLMTLKWSVLNLIITAPLLMVEPSLGDWISRRGASAAKAAITAHRINAVGRTSLADNLDIVSSCSEGRMGRREEMVGGERLPSNAD